MVMTREFFSQLTDTEKRILKEAERTARKIGAEAMKVSASIDHPYLIPQQTMWKFIEDLANFKDFTRATYCYVNHKIGEGYIALPTRTLYDDGRILVVPDKDYLDRLSCGQPYEYFRRCLAQQQRIARNKL